MIIDKNLSNGRDVIQKFISKAELGNKPRAFIAIPLSKIFPSFSAGIFFFYRKEKVYRGEFINATNGLDTIYFIGDNDR